MITPTVVYVSFCFFIMGYCMGRWRYLLVREQRLLMRDLDQLAQQVRRRET